MTKILVDYKNLPPQISRPGTIYLADSIVSAMRRAGADVRSADFRLYAGWDRGGRMTRSALDLSTEIRSQFPKTIKFDDIPVFISMQLAQSLETLPRKLLPNTLRREPARPLSCQVPSNTTCRQNPCPLDPMADFLNSGKCAVKGCVAEPKMLLYREEQKLVDAMMVADIIYLAANGETLVGIATEDDDIWPGILSALNVGANIVHVRTGHGYSQSLYLTQTKTTGKYIHAGL